MWVLLVAVAQAIVIGWVAQTKLKRTGVVWFLIALAVNFGLLYFVSEVVIGVYPHKSAAFSALSEEAQTWRWFLASMVPATIIITIVLATLPKTTPSQ
jgi:hypothetical protein